MQHILIADDHSVTRRGLKEIVLEAFPDCEVLEASSWGEVRSMASERPWSLMLLDVLMPGPPILEVLAEVRDAHPKVPILVITALTEVEYVFEVMNAGANGLVHKHFASDDLLQAIVAVSQGGNYLHPATAIEVAEALRRSAAPEPQQPHELLSGRELEVLKGIAKGLTVKELAWELQLSDKTVATYLKRIRDKAGLSSHVEIARYALQHGLVR